MPTLPLLFQGGLEESQEDSTVPEGYAVKLENWVPEPNGALRCRAGWTRTSTTGAPSTRKARGIGSLKLPYRRNLPVRVQKTKGGATSTANLTVTWGSTTTAGNLLVVAITAPGTTITPPAGWTRLGASSSGARIYYKENCGAEATALFTFSSATYAWVAAEYSGIATVSPVDQSAANNATSATPTTGSITTTISTELILAALSDTRNEPQSAPTNSFAEVDQQEQSTSRTIGLYERFVTSKGTYSTAVTTSTSDAWTSEIASFKATLQVPASYILVAHDNTTGFVIYKTDGGLAGTYSSIETISVTDTTQLVAFSQGLLGTVYTHVEFAEPRRFDGTTASALTGAPSGRTIAFHLNSFWIGGTLDQPARLYKSETGDYATWTGGTTETFDIGQDDGDAIEDVAVFEDGLLVAKSTSLWFLSGNTSDDFAVHRLNAGGSAKGRSICVTPYGALIADERQVWLWTGGSVESISAPVEDSYEITGDFCSTAYIDNVAYICDEGTGTLYCLDMRTGAWWTEKVDTATGCPAVISAFGDYLLYGPLSASNNSLLQYRAHPKDSRVKDPDTQTETFKAWTPQLWPQGPGKAQTPRKLYVEFRQRGGTAAQTGITITPVYDGVAQTAVTIAPQAAAGTYQKRLDLPSGRRTFGVQFKVEQVVASGEASLIDIERMVYEFNVEETA